jgi:hypothetical protein
LIDTLSFEKYCRGQSWNAYRQFCQHFLAPLALMSHKDVRLNQLSRIYTDGIPLDLVSSLLPLRNYFDPSLLLHIHGHSKFGRFCERKSIKIRGQKLSRLGFFALIDNLETVIRRLKCKSNGSGWTTYYNDTNYSLKAMQFKKDIVTEFIDQVHPKFVLDLLANKGVFSRIAGSKNAYTVSIDNDHAVVEENYLTCMKTKQMNIIPLVVDVINPSPSIGWECEERISFLKRGPIDTVLALAMIHHLAISHNIPLQKIANFFSKICNVLIIEFVPKNDSQVLRLFANRVDIFQDYTKENFEKVFGKHFTIRHSMDIPESERTLYLLQKHS